MYAGGVLTDFERAQEVTDLLLTDRPSSQRAKLVTPSQDGENEILLHPVGWYKTGNDTHAGRAT
jgi:hypothetical protein